MLRSVLLTMLPCALLLLPAGTSLAVPIVFQLDSMTITGATTASTQSYSPGLPLVGSGDIDFGAGTGTLSLPDHSIEIDLTGIGGPLDAVIDVTGWGQTITAIDGSGNITSIGSGAYSCLFPPVPCSVGPPANTGWAPADGAAPSSAVLDTGLRTITVVDNSDDGSTGTVTYSYSYTIVPVPEPGTALLLGAGLAVLGGMGRRRGGARMLPTPTRFAQRNPPCPTRPRRPSRCTRQWKARRPRPETG